MNLIQLEDDTFKLKDGRTLGQLKRVGDYSWIEFNQEVIIEKRLDVSNSTTAREVWIELVSFMVNYHFDFILNIGGSHAPKTAS